MRSLIVCCGVMLTAAVGCTTDEDCGPGLTKCGTSCHNLDADHRNCGACGTECNNTQYCEDAQCVLACPTGFTECSGTCVNLDDDDANCGMCAMGCTGNLTCSGANCVLECPPGQIACGGNCVDPAVDRANCGATGDCSGANAGVACGPGELCNGAGACALSCQAGLIDCGGECVNPLVDRRYCGASGNCQMANAGDACTAGEICDGAGACAVSCQQGLVDCNGTCIDPMTSRLHCGASGDCQMANAGAACSPGELCNGAGGCDVSCAGSLIDCNGTCIDPPTDRTYCGASGDCQMANAGVTCNAGELCNGMGGCDLTCAGTFIDCNGECIDPAANNSYCGASGDCQMGNAGVACQPWETCQMTGCEPNLIYVGSLIPASGRWAYGATFGQPGADATCGAVWPGSVHCTTARLQAAAARGELTAPVDATGAAVTTWWGVNPMQPVSLQCGDPAGMNMPYTYQTGHTGCTGEAITLTGPNTLNGPTIAACSLNLHVACCIP